MDEGPGEHDQHLMDGQSDGTDDASADTTSCPDCGAEIWADIDKCPRCGTWFHGQAWEKRVAGGGVHRNWVWWVTVIVLVAMVILLIRFGFPI